MPILGISASQISGHLITAIDAYESIATVTLSSGTGTMDITNIPSTFTHLQVRVIMRTNNGNTADNVRMRINGVTNGGYNGHWFNANGSSVEAGSWVNEVFTYVSQVPGANAGANIFGAFIIDILDYANTNKYKTVKTLGGHDQNGSNYVILAGGTLRSTSAVTSLSFYGDNSTIQPYSQIALYGIKTA